MARATSGRSAPATSASTVGSAASDVVPSSGSAEAQPITIDRSAGLRRAARRTCCRRSATASAVTAQLLNSATSASSGRSTIVPPSDSTIARTVSLSY
jgi:hypothetical protein